MFSNCFKNIVECFEKISAWNVFSLVDVKAGVVCVMWKGVFPVGGFAFLGN